MSTIVGLGNYQAIYSNTRHNIGFRVLNSFEDIIGTSPRTYLTCDEDEVAKIKRDADEFASKFFKTNDVWSMFSDAPENAIAAVSETENGDRIIYPMLGMNSSGDALLRVLEQTTLDLSDTLVVLDDLDLPFCQCRMKMRVKNSHHNGIRSIIDKLGRSDFCYMRVGIGKPVAGVSVLDYVLSPFTDQEEEYLESYIPRMADFVYKWLVEGPNAAMTCVNSI